MRPEGTAALALRRVSVSIDGHAIVQDVTLDARAGEILALVGPNGAGKTTLLGVLAGDIHPSAGEVAVTGRPLHQLSHKHLARERAVLTQEHTMSFPFTVRDVAAMGRAPWRGTDASQQDEEVVETALAVTDVTHLGARAFPTLSGGEKARSSLARVLAQGTRVMLLDEPTAALDVRHQEDVLLQAREAARAGLAVVVVLHDLSLAACHADRVAVLAGGRLVAVGPPADVFRPETLESVYEYPIDVIVHPRSGQLIVVPLRGSDHGPGSARLRASGGEPQAVTGSTPVKVDQA